MAGEPTMAPPGDHQLISYISRRTLVLLDRHRFHSAPASPRPPLAARPESGKRAGRWPPLARLDLIEQPLTTVTFHSDGLRTALPAGGYRHERW